MIYYSATDLMSSKKFAFFYSPREITPPNIAGMHYFESFNHCVQCSGLSLLITQSQAIPRSYHYEVANSHYFSFYNNMHHVDIAF